MGPRVTPAEVQAIAGHLAVALQSHRHRAARQNVDYPPFLADLEHFALELGRSDSGQTGTDGSKNGDSPSTGGNLASHDSELLNHTQAADLLGVYPKTVGRMLKRGKLRGVEADSRSQRIPRHEIDRFTGTRGDD